MRTTLRTTTAVLACLNLAIPFQAFAQGGGESSASSVCASDPVSQECRDAVAKGLDKKTDGAAGEAPGAKQGQDAAPAPGTDSNTNVEQAEDPGVAPAKPAGKKPKAEAAAPEAPGAGKNKAKAAAAERKKQKQQKKNKEAAAEDAGGAGQTSAERAAASTGAGAKKPVAEAAPENDATAAAPEETPPAETTTEAPRPVEKKGQTSAAKAAAGEPVARDAQTEDATAAAPEETPPAEATAEAPKPAGKAGQTSAAKNAGGTATAADKPKGRNAAPDTGTANASQGGKPLAAAAAADGTAEPEEVTTETVTEETARSSAEDFASGIDQSPDASEDDDDDGGLSKLEKALLLGAGALAVGTIMRNGREVVASSDDRVVVSGSDGDYELIKDDNALLRQPGSEVQTQTFDDGSTRTVVSRPDGSQIVTIRDAQLRVVRRVRITPDGQQVVLIDDTEQAQPVDPSTLQPTTAETSTFSQSMDEEALRQALSAQQGFDRAYSLNQIRSIEQVRRQVPAIDLENITFPSGSAAISPEQADELTRLGQYIDDRIAENPREIFLVEGHTDAVGDAAYNLALSDRRAESVALALTEYFDVPPENLVVQGYGEQFLKVQTDQGEQANRRASIRRITPLLQVAAGQ